MPAEPQPSGRRLPIGLMVAGSEMASFTILGVLIDFGLGSMPWFTVGLTLFGVFVAFYHLVKMTKALRDQKPEPPGSPPAGGTP